MKKILSSLLAAAILLGYTAFPSKIMAQSAKIYSDGAAGDMVVRFQIRLRELGYLNYRPTGVYRAMTVDAVKAFQERSSAVGGNLAVDGRLGEESIAKLFALDAPRAKIPDGVHIPRGPVADRLKTTGELVEWSSVKNLLSSGKAYKVTDCNTSESFTLVFTGGEGHAEMELFSKDDKAVFDKICGSEYNYMKRPVTVRINGANIAASMQCWPHGDQTKTENGMEGHVCVFFSGSRSAVFDLADREHDAIVLQAAGR